MALNLAPYRAQIATAQRRLREYLARGRATSDDIAVARRTLEIMKAQLNENPTYVAGFDNLAPLKSGGGPQLWEQHCAERAEKELIPERADHEAYAKKYAEYIEFGERLIQSVDFQAKSTVDKYSGKSYLFIPNGLTQKAMQVVAAELVRWFQHQADPKFIRKSAQEGYVWMLSEHPDLVAMLRIAQELRYDVEVSEVPIERPVEVTVVETAISLVPLVGSIVAAYEAYTGKDLFGYTLTGVERGILAASVLLPIAGRLVKGGRAVYAEARMVALYGRDAASWSQMVSASGLATADAHFFQILTTAEEKVHAGRSLSRGLAIDAAKVVRRFSKGLGTVSREVDQAAIDLFQKLSSRHAILDNLDAFAIQRILEKGPNVDHLKGQLLEELIESRVVPWLSTRTGPAALGVSSSSERN
jgi:hypothetical protein